MLSKTYSGGVPCRLNSSKIILTLSPGNDKMLKIVLDLDPRGSPGSALKL